MDHLEEGGSGDGSLFLILFTICMKIRKEVQPPCSQKLLDQQNSPYESQELGGKFLNYITATKNVATFILHSSTDQQQLKR